MGGVPLVTSLWAGNSVQYDATDPNGLADASKHYTPCHTPANPKARMTNLLLTMMHKMEVRTEQFVDSLEPISDLMA